MTVPDQPNIIDPSIFALLDRAAQIVLPAERSAFLDRECAGNAELKAKIQEILSIDIIAGTTNMVDVATARCTQRPIPITNTTAQFAESGPWIGPYKLVQVIGEGGMGRVYLAEQEAPVRRRVALKLVRPGNDNSDAIARFEAERQALALMDHPSIARVFDAGSTPDGLPYFVMELVPGIAITAYCDLQKLSIKERLRLFVQVCAAIQHAHQHGIIHRDIKPSNVLVAVGGDVPLPKIIDFGIAKAFNRKLGDKTLTIAGEVFGTLEYMSPEQASSGAGSVDTRSDVYSLGVLLYELLTGTTPHRCGRRGGTLLPDLLLVICEQDPPKPSTRLLSGTSRGEIAVKRGTDCGGLARQVRGELDWIVMRALEKDRTRRYESAAALAADISNYLDDRPVTACPPSRRYLFSKWVRRNKILAASACMVTLSVLAALSISSHAYFREHAALERAVHAESVSATDRDIARESEAQARLAETRARADRDAAVKAESAARQQRDSALAEKRRADDEASVAKAVNDFLRFDFLIQLHPLSQPRNSVDPNKLTLRAVLDKASLRIAGRFENHPLIEATIRQTVADAYAGLSEHAIAVRHLEIAVAKFSEVLGPFENRTVVVKRNLASNYHSLGQFAKAIAVLRPVLDHFKEEERPEHPTTLALQSDLAVYLHHAGQHDEARELCLKTLDAFGGNFELDRDHVMETLAEIYTHTGAHERGIELERSFEEWSRKRFGPDNPQSITAALRLGEMLIDGGKLTEALDVFPPAVERFKALLGATNSRVLNMQFELGRLYARAQKTAEARALLRATLETAQKSLNPKHEVIGFITKELAALDK